MHSPIKYAANELLQRGKGVTLEQWCSDNAELTPQIAVIKLNTDTEGVVLVDKRTIERWFDEVAVA